MPQQGMEQKEIWRPIAGLEEVAEVSNMGRVRTIDRYYARKGGKRKIRGRICAQHITKYGYFEVAITVDKTILRFRVHRLVALTFVAGAFDGAVVDHLDCDKQNNRWDNLEWVSVSENTKRQHAAGILKKPRDNNPIAKLTDLQAHAVRILYHHNFPPKLIGEWFGVSDSLAYQIGKDGKPPVPLRSRASPTLGPTRRLPAVFT
jgi:hypothetical protein